MGKGMNALPPKQGGKYNYRKVQQGEHTAGIPTSTQPNCEVGTADNLTWYFPHTSPPPRKPGPQATDTIVNGGGGGEAKSGADRGDVHLALKEDMAK